MGILDEWLRSDAAKALAIPVSRSPAPGPERDFDAEAQRDLVTAFGEHVLDGLPIRHVRSADARRAEAEAAAELAVTRASAEAAAGEQLRIEGEMLALGSRIRAAEAAQVKRSGEERVAAIDAEMARRGLAPGDPRFEDEKARRNLMSNARTLETLVSEWMSRNDPRGMTHGRFVALLRNAPRGEPRDPETVAILCAAEVARQAQTDAEAKAGEELVADWVSRNDSGGMTARRLVQLLRSGPLGVPGDRASVEMLCAAEVQRQAEREAAAAASGDDVAFVVALGDRDVVNLPK
jgi:hypothetical protein